MTDDIIVKIPNAIRSVKTPHFEPEWYQSILASIGDAVITTDVEGRVTFLNQVAESLTGWTEEDAAGKPLELIFKIINQKTRKPVESPAAGVLGGGEA